MSRPICLLIAPWLVLFALQTGWASRPAVRAPSDEKIVWAQAAREESDLEQRWSVLEYPAIDRYIESIVRQLWDQVDSDLPRMRVRLLDNSMPDAFAYPNGVCYLTSGMLLQTASRDQLAMVLAHEMIHYTHRHALSAYRWSHVAARGGPDNAATIRDAGLSFSEAAAERQADREGLKVLMRAGFCAEEALAIAAVEVDQDSAAAGPQDAGFNFDAIRPHRFEALHRMLRQDHAGAPCRIDSACRRSHWNILAPVALDNARQALQKGAWVQAQESIRRYLAVRPTDPEGYFIRGEILRLTPGGQDRDGVEAAYRKAIALDPLYLPAYKALGVVYLKSGHKAKARSCFEHYLAYASNDGQAGYIRRYLQLCGE